jgi:hypothetical protein
MEKYKFDGEKFERAWELLVEQAPNPFGVYTDDKFLELLKSSQNHVDGDLKNLCSGIVDGWVFKIEKKDQGMILSYPILSYPILSYPILSYPILSYPILSI